MDGQSAIDQIIEILRIGMLGLGVESGLTSLYWFWTILTSERGEQLGAVRFWVLGVAFFQFGVAVRVAELLFGLPCCVYDNLTVVVASDILIVCGQVLAIVAGCHFFLWHRWREIVIGLVLRAALILFVARFVI